MFEGLNSWTLSAESVAKALVLFIGAPYLQFPWQYWLAAPWFQYLTAP